MSLDDELLAGLPGDEKPISSHTRRVAELLRLPGAEDRWHQQCEEARRERERRTQHHIEWLEARRDLLSAALDYRARGWSIIPVIGKRAAGLWKPFQKIPADDATLRRMFARPRITSLSYWARCPAVWYAVTGTTQTPISAGPKITQSWPVASPRSRPFVAITYTSAGRKASITSATANIAAPARITACSPRPVIRTAPSTLGLSPCLTAICPRSIPSKLDCLLTQNMLRGYSGTLSKPRNNAVDAILEWLANWPDGKQTLTLGRFAGTGKTTILSYLSKHLSGAVFAAPTGKAAQRLREKGVRASTIHSLIYAPLHGKNGQVQFVPRRHLDAETICIDESSMVDECMHLDLHRYAVPVLYVGDHGQLERKAGPTA